MFMSEEGMGACSCLQKREGGGRTDKDTNALEWKIEHGAEAYVQTDPQLSRHENTSSHPASFSCCQMYALSRHVPQLPSSVQAPFRPTAT